MATPKVALITGSGKRRLGWHVAEGLAARGYGLVIHYRSSAAEAVETVAEFRRRGVEALAVQADLADEKSTGALVAAARDWFGRLDVLVNCAAIWERKPLEAITADDVRRHFEVKRAGNVSLQPRRRAGDGGSAGWWLDRHIRRLGGRAAVSRICSLFSLEGSRDRADSVAGSRTGRPQPARADQLHSAGTGNVARESFGG